MPPDSPAHEPETRLRNRRLIGLAIGAAGAAAILAFADLEPGRPEVTRTAAVAFLMATWWVTEALPLGITALVPVVLFPLLGVMDGGEVSSLYFNHVIFLFIGGFLVAMAMQRWGLHRRMALRILLVFGSEPKRLLLGFMVATAFLSMWVSNTATTMMLVPVAVAVAASLGAWEEGEQRYAVVLLLGVAFGASIGGVATLVGTPPNLAFASIYEITFPGAPEISFVTWLAFGLPVSAVMLLLTWGVLAAWHLRGRTGAGSAREVLRRQLDDLGPVSYEQKVVLGAFVGLALLWITRADIEIGAATIPGWSGLFGNPGFINDGTVAIAVALVLFMIPSRRQPGERIMEWENARELPWQIVLLFGGGFALAGGFAESGLAGWIGAQLESLESLPTVLVVLGIALLVTFLTEINSNTATAQTLLPILAALAISIQVHPLLLMLPATVAASFAFMLPVATPPNAIVFGTGHLRIAQMARVGLVINLLGALVITGAVLLLAEPTLGVDLFSVPEWAAP